MFWFINFLIKMSLLITFLIINEFIDKKILKKIYSRSRITPDSRKKWPPTPDNFYSRRNTSTH
jgi:hypothetical protein